MIRSHPNYKYYLKSIFQLDSIRIHKFLHMAQDAIITIFFCFFIAIHLNKFLDVEKDEKDENIESVLTSYVKLIIHILLIILALYYVRKITKLIPFIFNFDKNYNPFHKSKDGESLIGNTTAVALIFAYTQSNLSIRFNTIIKKWV